MKKVCSGTGIIPVIKSSNDTYYFVLFKSIIRKNYSINPIEDAGGKYEGNSIKLSAIRELKEESCLLFNLENIQEKESILQLNRILTDFSFANENSRDYYVSHFVYLENKSSGYFDFKTLRNDYINNLKNFWKTGFSVYTENKDIVFIPIEAIKDIKSEYIKDYTGIEHLLYKRTYQIFGNLNKNYDINDFINKLIEKPIILDRIELDNYKYSKENITNLICYDTK